MNTKKTVLFCLLSLFGLLTLAQSISFSDVFKLEYRNAGYIQENDQIKGYYIFYQMDKVAKKTFAYRLQILDEHMKEAVSTIINRPKSYSLVEATFNGRAFLFLFFDQKKQAFELATFDKQGQELGVKQLEARNPKDRALFWSTKYGPQVTQQGDEMGNPTIYPVGNHGFLRMFPMYTGALKFGVTLEYYPNDLSESTFWSVKTPDKVYETKEILSVHGEYATIFSSQYNTRDYSQSTGGIQVLDMRTGKKVLESNLIFEKKGIKPQFCEYLPESKEILILGNYFDAKATNPTNLINGQGFCGLKLDLTGSVVQKNFMGWKENASQFLDINEKGKLKSGGSISIHKIIQTSSGELFAIGEEYIQAKASSGGASSGFGKIKGGALSSQASPELGNMVIFKFANDLTLEDVRMFEKQHSKVTMPIGFSLAPPGSIAILMKAFGLFDYAYTQQSKDKKQFFVSYFSSIKEKDKKKEPIFGVIVRDETGEFSTDQIHLTTEASEMWVLPAKAGHVAICEYFQKDKRIDVRLEPINY
ncbi:MAG: DUF6770 family protein [Bacteroidota bacterium]